MEQVPPQIARKAKDDELEREKVALAKQRQDRLDRERLEKNIKYGLGLVGSLALTGAGLYHTGKKLDIATQRLEQGNQQLSIQQQNLDAGSERVARQAETQMVIAGGRNVANILHTGAQLIGTAIRGGTSLASTGASLASSTINAGTALANTGMREYSRMYEYDPANADAAASKLARWGRNAALAAGAAAAIAGIGAVGGMTATIVGQEGTTNFSDFLARKFVEGGIGIIWGGGKGAMKGIVNSGKFAVADAFDELGGNYVMSVLADGTYDLKNSIGETIMSGVAYAEALYRAYDVSKVMPYEEFIKTLPPGRLRPGGVWGFQPPPTTVLGQFTSAVKEGLDLSYDKTFNFFSPPDTFSFDVNSLLDLPPHKWPQEAYDKIQLLPADVILSGLRKSGMTKEPNHSARFSTAEQIKKRENKRLLWEEAQNILYWTEKK
jgi:hypothetical protein